MTDKQRDIIERNVAESRRLGKEADKAGDKVVSGLRQAARASHSGTRQYRAVGGAEKS